jgi:hypothetical protein
LDAHGIAPVALAKADGISRRRIEQPNARSNVIESQIWNLSNVAVLAGERKRLKAYMMYVSHNISYATYGHFHGSVEPYFRSAY